MPMVSVPMPVGLPVAGTVPTSVPVMTAEEQREWESTYTQGASEVKEKKKKEKKFVRVAGDTVWEDNSLAEWEQGKKVIIYLLSFCNIAKTCTSAFFEM